MNEDEEELNYKSTVSVMKSELDYIAEGKEKKKTTTSHPADEAGADYINDDKEESADSTSTE